MADLEQRARAVHQALEAAGWHLGLHAVHAVLEADRALGSRLDAVDAALERLKREPLQQGYNRADTTANQDWQQAVMDTLAAMRDVLAALCGQPPAGGP